MPSIALSNTWKKYTSMRKSGMKHIGGGRRPGHLWSGPEHDYSRMLLIASDPNSCKYGSALFIQHRSLVCFCLAILQASELAKLWSNPEAYKCLGTDAVPQVSRCNSNFDSTSFHRTKRCGRTDRGVRNGLMCWLLIYLVSLFKAITAPCLILLSFNTNWPQREPLSLFTLLLHWQFIKPDCSEGSYHIRRYMHIQVISPASMASTCTFTNNIDVDLGAEDKGLVAEICACIYS